MTKKRYQKPEITRIHLEACTPLAHSITAGTGNPTEKGSATGETPTPGDNPFSAFHSKRSMWASDHDNDF